MESEGPYNPYKHQTEMWGTKECDKQCKACIYAEGRKAAENYTEKMLKIATNEVRKCHEEIRRLEDKYARNVYKMPPYNPSFDEKEHSALVENGAKAWAGHKEEKYHTEKDFNELLDNTGFLATILHQIAYKWIHGDDDIPGEGCDCPKEFARESLRLSCEEFFAWKKARGLE